MWRVGKAIYTSYIKTLRLRPPQISMSRSRVIDHDAEKGKRKKTKYARSNTRLLLSQSLQLICDFRSSCDELVRLADVPRGLNMDRNHYVSTRLAFNPVYIIYAYFRYITFSLTQQLSVHCWRFWEWIEACWRWENSSHILCRGRERRLWYLLRTAYRRCSDIPSGSGVRTGWPAAQRKLECQQAKMEHMLCILLDSDVCTDQLM